MRRILRDNTGKSPSLGDCEAKLDLGSPPGDPTQDRAGDSSTPAGRTPPCTEPHAKRAPLTSANGSLANRSWRSRRIWHTLGSSRYRERAPPPKPWAAESALENYGLLMEASPSIGQRVIQLEPRRLPVCLLLEIGVRSASCYLEMSDPRMLENCKAQCRLEGKARKQGAGRS